MGIECAAEPAGVTAVLDAFVAADLDARPDLQLADDLRELAMLRNRVDAEFARRLGAFDARGAAAADGAFSTAAWLRINCLMSPATASSRVHLARQLHGGGPLADAMGAGVVSQEHAVVIAYALTQLPAGAADAAEQILTLAATGVHPGDLRAAAHRIREALAPELLVSEGQTAFDGRQFNVSATLNGTVRIDGLLDPEGGAALLALVHALATPLGPADTRTATQRRADALVEAVAVALKAGELPVTSGHLPQMALTADITPFLMPGHNGVVNNSAGGAPENSGAGGGGDAGNGGVGSCWPVAQGIPVAYTSHGGILAGETVRRILCDAQVHRVVTAGPSEILDIGRATRIIPTGIRRALNVRDGGCAAEHCDRPAAWTDAHHIVHWSHGGETKLNNLVLLCRVHHILVHEFGWVVEPVGHGFFVRPPGRDDPPPPDRQHPSKPRYG